MTWIEQIQDWGVLLLITAVFYFIAGAGFRSLHPTGMLNRQGRRWRNGGALFLILGFAGIDLFFALRRGRMGLAVGMISYVGLGLLLLLLIHWWWQDWREEKATRNELIENLRREGRDLVGPPTSRGKKVWRWALNGYAIVLIVALIYGLVRYLAR